MNARRVGTWMHITPWKKDVVHVDSVGELSEEERELLKLFFLSQPQRRAMTISEFRRENVFLSNYFPCRVTVQGITYGSSEAAFHAGKTLDRSVRMELARCRSAAAAKKLGRRLELRPGWDNERNTWMKHVLRCKFNPSRNEELALKLKATEPHVLVEGNNWGDTYWGATWRSYTKENLVKLPPCWAVEGDRVLCGNNWLGVLLLDLRDQLVLTGE